MKEISTYLIAENLPESIQRQNTVDVARAIDERLQEINAWSDLVLLLPNIDSLSAELLDHLAYQFHVDFYDSSMSLQEKRSLVKNSIKWHMRKGTPAAVEEMVATVFESADTEEWFDYDGEPYHFRVTGIGASIPDVAIINKLVDAINQSKNTRSWLDYIRFIRSVDGFINFNNATMNEKEITINSDISEQIYISKSVYVGGTVITEKELEVNVNG